MRKPLPPPDVDFVLARVDSSGGEDSCWEWKKSTNSSGYGIVNRFKKVYFPHRIMLESVHGPLGETCALHTCDNRLCCNPKHLFPGTRADNMKDMTAKGRHWGGPKKLSDAQVADLIAREHEFPTRTALAKAFGVSAPLVTAILKNGHRARKLA